MSDTSAKLFPNTTTHPMNQHGHTRLYTMTQSLLLHR